jgi:hypothetical protein
MPMIEIKESLERIQLKVTEGLVVLDTGVEWYMGNHGSFSETVERM